MRSKAQISVRHIGQIAILDATGSLTEDSEEELNQAYDQTEVKGLSKILINFHPQSFITSSGFGLIVKLIWKARNKGQILRIAHPSDQVRKNFSVIGLTRSINVFDSEEAALADF